MHGPKRLMHRLGGKLSKLSFRSGVIVLCACVCFYAISFAQMLLPTSAGMKGILWIVFFGLAKAAQYTAIAILGTNGLRRILKKRDGR